jgi:molybdate transport system ATP-binding protein
MAILEVDFKKKMETFVIEQNFKLDNEILILFGPSGAGKTTTLDCIAGLQKPDEGKIKLNGRYLFSKEEKINLPPFKRRVAYLFQEYALFPHLTVKENVFYSLNARQREEKKDKFEDLMSICQIKELQMRYPEQLSGGEKQRVALVRSLMSNPDLLLLDEPFSSLDEELRSNLQIRLKEIQDNWGIPFVFITHNREETEFMGDKVLKINLGKVIKREKNDIDNYTKI